MAEAAPQMSLAVGDRVVYPNQGVCRVFGVDTKEVAGQTLTFVSMRREEDGAVVMVPTAKVQSIGLRKLATKDDVGKIFAFLRSDSDKADLDWKQRARTNLDRMTQGGIRGLAEVVKGLQVLSELRPLPTKERELYDNARHLLVSEISASLTIPECDAEDAIDIVLSPPGRERPKRSAEEFRPPPAADEEGLDLAEDLLSLGGDLDLPADEERESEETEEEGESETEEVEAKPAAKRGRRAEAARPERKKAPAAIDRESVAKRGRTKAKEKAHGDGLAAKADGKQRGRAAASKVAGGRNSGKPKPGKATPTRTAKSSARKKK